MPPSLSLCSRALSVCPSSCEPLRVPLCAPSLCAPSLRASSRCLLSVPLHPCFVFVFFLCALLCPPSYVLSLLCSLLPTPSSVPLVLLPLFLCAPSLCPCLFSCSVPLGPSYPYTQPKKIAQALDVAPFTVPVSPWLVIVVPLSAPP